MFRRRTREVAPPDPGFIARGWIEPVFGEMKEGMFNAEQGETGPMTWLSFSPTGAHYTETMRFPWSDVNSVRLQTRAELPASVTNAHASLFAWKGLTDPNVIVGWLSGRSGVPRSDLFMLVPIEPIRTSEQWMELFSRAGVEILNPNSGAEDKQ